MLSGIGGADGGEVLEWELPSDHEEEEEAVQGSALRLTEEWKQYEATYGQSYTERYFASYYHAQVGPSPLQSPMLPSSSSHDSHAPNPCSAASHAPHCCNKILASKRKRRRMSRTPLSSSV